MMTTKLKSIFDSLSHDVEKGNRKLYDFKLRTFIAVCLLALAQSGWGQWVADETYNFAEYAAYQGATLNMTGNNVLGIAAAQYASSITTTSNGTLDLNNRFVFRTLSSSGHGWELLYEEDPPNVYSGLNKSRYADRTPDFYICNLMSGDKVKVTFSGSMSKIDGETTSSIYSDQELTSDGEGKIHLISTQVNTLITKVEIMYYRTSGVTAVMYNFQGDFATDRTPGNAGGDNGFIILNMSTDINNSPIEVANYSPPSNRFGVDEQGWVLKKDGSVSGLYNGVNKSTTSFRIYELSYGDNIKIDYSGSGNISINSGGTWNSDYPSNQVIFCNGGTLELEIPRYMYIQKIYISSRNSSYKCY